MYTEVRHGSRWEESEGGDATVCVLALNHSVNVKDVSREKQVESKLRIGDESSYFLTFLSTDDEGRRLVVWGG